MLDSAFLMRRQEPGFWGTAISYVIGLLVGLALSATLLVWVGVPADALVDEFLVETFMTSDGLAQTVTAAGPLILVGLASAITMRIRFWNIGIEGQIWMGAIAATFIAIDHIGPEALRLPLGLLLAFLAGAVWILPCLILKRRWGVNEVITTLLSGNIAFLFVQHLLFGAWRDPANSFPISVEYPPASQFSALGWGQVHSGVILSIVIAVIVWFLLERSPVGFYAEATGFNPGTAEQTGLPGSRTIALLVMASGGLAGLGGAVIASGTQHHLDQALGNGYLFAAIVIAYLARSKPFWVVFVSVALGSVYTASDVLKVFYSVSEGIIVLAQGTVLISVLISQFFSVYWIRRAGRASG